MNEKTPDQRQLSALRYMTKFRCLGSDCSDHCCRGWAINLDHDDYNKLKDMRETSPLVKAHFEVAIEKRLDTPSQKVYATLKTCNNGKCFFEEEGLCSIHRDFGEAMLPKICATYPRKVFNFDGALLMNGFISCPEVARLCLLEEDAIDLVPMSVEQIPVQVEILPWSSGSADYFKSCSGNLREVILGLLRQRDLPIHQGLFLVVYLAKKIGPFFHRGLTEDPSARLQKVFDKLLDPTHQKKLVHGLERESVYSKTSLQLICLVLSARDNHNQARYRELAASIWASYGFNPAAIDDAEQLALLWDAFQSRKTRLFQRYGDRMELVLRNYSYNSWFLEPVFAEEELIVFVRRFILSFAVIKFLICGHPDLLVLLEEDLSPEEGQARLDAIVLYCIQTFSRCMTHNSVMMSYLGELLKRFDVSDVVSLTTLLHP